MFPPPNYQWNNPPVDLRRLQICSKEKKKKWGKKKTGISWGISCHCFSVYVETWTEHFVFWLARLPVVSALTLVNASLEHTPFKLWNHVQVADFPINVVFSLFFCSSHPSDTFCCHSCLLPRVHSDCPQGRKRRWQRGRPCRIFPGERAFPDLHPLESFLLLAWLKGRFYMDSRMQIVFK